MFRLQTLTEVIAHDACKQEVVQEASHGDVVVHRERFLLLVHFYVIQDPANTLGE